MAAAFLKGLQRAFVLGAAKHFPGHGHAFMDTHLHPSLAPQDEGFSERFQRGLWPFRALVASGVPIIIPSHVRYPAYDPDLPATFSQALLSGLLRGTLGFQGAVVSDDLLMQAALAPFQEDIAEAAVRRFGRLRCTHNRPGQGQAGLGDSWVFSGRSIRTNPG